MSSPRQKAKDLIELWADESTSKEERLSAGMKAVAIIRKHDLLSSPLDNLLSKDDSETVEAAKDIFSTFTDPKFMGNLKKIGGKIAQTARGARARRRR